VTVLRKRDHEYVPQTLPEAVATPPAPPASPAVTPDAGAESSAPVRSQPFLGNEKPE